MMSFTSWVVEEWDASAFFNAIRVEFSLLMAALVAWSSLTDCAVNPTPKSRRLQTKLYIIEKIVA